MVDSSDQHARIPSPLPTAHALLHDHQIPHGHIPHPRWRRHLLPGLLISALPILGGAMLWSTLPSTGTVRVAGPSLEIAEATLGPFQEFLALRGEIVPATSYLITAQSDGRVRSVMASDEAHVTAGQILAQLDNAPLTLAISTAEATISGKLSDATSQLIALQNSREQRDHDIADATYASSKAAQDLAKHQFLRDRGIINDMALQPYQMAVDYQRARLTTLIAARVNAGQIDQQEKRQIQDNTAQLRRTLRQAQEALQALTLTAPDGGRLTDFALKPGQSVKQGDTLGQVDAEDADTVRAQVDEYYAPRLSPGLSATAAVHGTTTTLTLTRIFPQIVNGRISVELAFKNRQPTALRRGEAVDIHLSLGDARSALRVPTGPWLTDSGGASVFVINADGTAADRRAVSVGRRNPDQVEILSGLWRQVAPAVPLTLVSARDYLDPYYRPDRNRAHLFNIGAGVAALIGCVGLYGMAACNTARRRQEIGLRKVLGATRGAVVRLLVIQFMRPVLLANLLAWPVAYWALHRWLQQFDDRVPLGIAYFLAASALALLIALATVAGLAFASAGTQPARALRSQ